MKKLFLIFAISFVIPALAAGPLDGIKNASGKVGSGIKTVFSKVGSGIKSGFSKVGSGIKSGFGKVKDVLGLSAEDIEARKQERTKRKAERTKRKADAAAADVSMLESAAIAGDEFDNNVDAILESDEVTDPSAELESLEDDYRTTIENITAGKSGKYVNVINQDMETTINSARNLINKNPEKLKEFRNNATSVNRTNMIDKAITGVSTAAMGIGGMELAQGLSEQKSDKAATAEMQNYLSNLYCTYSDKQVKYGVTDVKIDDGNNLDLLREEFLTKAATLKYTKEQLGLKAGLESEVVFDDKATALYETQGTKRAASKFGRLSEALMNESGTDAQMLAEQQEKSKNRVTGGAIAVVGGVAASIGGNALINSIGNKDKNAEVDEGENNPDNANIEKDEQDESSSDLSTQMTSKSIAEKAKENLNNKETSGVMGPPTEEDFLSDKGSGLSNNTKDDNDLVKMPTLKPVKIENVNQSEPVMEMRNVKIKLMEMRNVEIKQDFDYVDSPVSVPDYESYQVNENLDNMT